MRDGDWVGEGVGERWEGDEGVWLGGVTQMNKNESC